MNTKTKSGAASLYVVIFTTLLLGIITLGFVRIMLSEAVQTSNSDLSQSAFDSALAGIEDAKVALLKYHDCLSDNATTQASCEDIIVAMQHETSTSNCDIVREILFGREAGEEHETIIQSSTDGVGSEMEQAYTCVLISEDNDNYLGQLNDNYHSKIVPLRTANLDSLEYVRVDWYSSVNASTNAPNVDTPSSNLKSTNKPANYDDNSNTGLLPARDTTNPMAPPILGVQLLQTDTAFTFADLDLNNGNNTNRGALLLYPSDTATDTLIESTASTGFSASADKAINIPTAIKCQPNNSTEIPYFCSATLAIPKPYNGGSRNEGSTFLRVFLPYGTPDTDFSVTLCRDSSCAPGSTMPFLGVQARIDSTGRANDLFRRVEVRVELVDVYFPFPEYSAAITGDGLDKNFWVTKNNWGYADSGYVK